MFTKTGVRKTIRVGIRSHSVSHRSKSDLDDLNQYSDAKKTKASLERALKEAKIGKLHSKL